MNVCDCPEPPGGSVRCRDDQLAICGYQNGKIVSGCYDRPAYAGFLTALHEGFGNLALPRLDNLVICNWTISTTTGSRRTDADPIEESHLAMLRSGQCESLWTGEVLKFRLPRIIHVESWTFAKEFTVDPTKDADANFEGHPDALEEQAVTEWMKSAAEAGRLLQRSGGIAEMNRALAELERWYELVLSSASPLEVSQIMRAEVDRELSRLSHVEANGTMARLARWIGETKRTYLFGLRRARKEDVAALWAKLLLGQSV